MHIYIYIFSSKSLDVEQSLYRYIYIYISLYLYFPVNGSLLPKYRDCSTSNDFDLYIYIYIYMHILSSLLPLRSAGRSKYDKGLHNLIMLIKKRHKIFIKIRLLYQENIINRGQL